MDLNKLSNDQLGELYAGVIGYNPFHEHGAEPNDTRVYALEVLNDSRFRSDIDRELKEIYIEVNAHTITRKGTTVFVHPGTTEWKGVKNKEDSYTELTEFEARKRMALLERKLKNENTNSEHLKKGVQYSHYTGSNRQEIVSLTWLIKNTDDKKEIEQYANAINKAIAEIGETIARLDLLNEFK